MSFEDESKADGYWKENIRLVSILLTIWAVVYAAKTHKLDKKYGVDEE